MPRSAYRLWHRLMCSQRTPEGLLYLTKDTEHRPILGGLGKRAGDLVVAFADEPEQALFN